MPGCSPECGLKCRCLFPPVGDVLLVFCCIRAHLIHMYLGCVLPPSLDQRWGRPDSNMRCVVGPQGHKMFPEVSILSAGATHAIQGAPSDQVTSSGLLPAPALELLGRCWSLSRQPPTLSAVYICGCVGLVGEDGPDPLLGQLLAPIPVRATGAAV